MLGRLVLRWYSDGIEFHACCGPLGTECAEVRDGCAYDCVTGWRKEPPCGLVWIGYGLPSVASVTASQPPFSLGPWCRCPSREKSAFLGVAGRHMMAVSASIPPWWYRSVTMRSAFRRASRRRTRTHRASSPASDHPHPDSSASSVHAASHVGEGPA